MDIGSKTIARVGKILRILQDGPSEGMSSTEIAEAAGFSKATAYRALISMVNIGLVDRDSRRRKFRLGVYLFNLGAVAARRFSVLSHAREAIAEIARETGDTVFLSVRSRFESVCIDCALGSYPIRAQTLSVGESIPLGVSTAGVAMLSTMSNDEVRHALQFNAMAISRFARVRPEQILSHVDEGRRLGYSLYAGQVIAGMAGIARPICDLQGRALAVITVTSLLERMNESRIKMINDLLKRKVAEIEDRALLVGNRLETFA